MAHYFDNGNTRHRRWLLAVGVAFLVFIMCVTATLLASAARVRTLQIGGSTTAHLGPLAFVRIQKTAMDGGFGLNFTLQDGLLLFALLVSIAMLLIGLASKRSLAARNNAQRPPS